MTVEPPLLAESFLETIPMVLQQYHNYATVHMYILSREEMESFMANFKCLQ